MGLSLVTIAIWVGIAIVYAIFIPADWRKWALFLISIVFIYTLQPSIFVRWLDFFLPTLSLFIVASSWYLTRNDEQAIACQDWLALGLIIGAIIALSLLRFVDPDLRYLVASRPPPLQFVLIAISIFLVFAVSVNKLVFRHSILLISMVLLFVTLKTDFIAIWVSRLIRTGTGQDVSLASSLDLNWLGFSYIAFRIIHTIRDRQSGLLPELSLQEYVSYVLFFPSLIAGPIDRAERFVEDFRKLPETLNFEAQYIDGFIRISVGIFKKFVIADTLAQGLSLTPINALQADNVLGLWVLLYGYAFRLFFDFSGYSDIVIGIGILFGILLPENFTQPYTRTSITKFWQSWHITLSNWARFYMFTPLSRQLLRYEPKPSPILIVLISQLSTMILIGLWHGVTINFLVWGIWHGLGLFSHKQFSDRTRPFYRKLKKRPRQQMIANGIAWFITFQFVVLGWVWFVMPDFEQALLIFAKLFGLR